MPKFEVLKNSALGISLVGAALFGGKDESQAQENPPAAQARDTKLKDAAQDVDSSLSIPEIKKSIEAIQKATRDIEKGVKVLPASLREEYAEHSYANKENVQLLNERLKTPERLLGDDGEFAKGVLKSIYRDLAGWNQRIEEEKAGVAPGVVPPSATAPIPARFVLPGSEGLGAPVVVLSPGDLAVVNLFTKYELPLIEKLMPEKEWSKWIDELGDPNSELRKGGGVVPGLSQKLTKEYGSARDIRHKKLEAERLRNLEKQNRLTEENSKR